MFDAAGFIDGRLLSKVDTKGLNQLTEPINNCGQWQVASGISGKLDLQKKNTLGRVKIKHRGTIFASHPAALGSCFGATSNFIMIVIFSGKFLGVAEICRQHISLHCTKKL